MRALESEIEFSNFLKYVGDKIFPTHKNLRVNIIEMFTNLVGNEQAGIITSV